MTKPAKKTAKPKKLAHSNIREEVADKLARVIERLDTISRRYFGGDNTQLLAAQNEISELAKLVPGFPTDWEPKRKGKKAIIPGTLIRLREDIDLKRSETYKHMGGHERYRGAKVTSEMDNRTFVVELKDKTRTLVPKRDVVAEDGTP